MNVVGPFAKKLEILLFLEIVVIGQSSSKCPGSSSHIVKRQRKAKSLQLCTRNYFFLLFAAIFYPSKPDEKFTFLQTNRARLNLMNNGFPCSAIFVIFKPSRNLSETESDLSCKVSFKYQCLILHGQT